MFTGMSRTDTSFEGEFHDDTNRVTLNLDGLRLVSRVTPS